MALLFLPLVAALFSPLPAQDPAEPQGIEALLAGFAEQGIALELEAGRMTLPVKITQRYEPLEYLLCLQPQGKDFESLLSIENTTAEALNTAFLLLGAEMGTLGRIVGVDPPPTMEEMQQGVMPYFFEPAYGGVGFRAFVEWEVTREDGSVEPYRFRAEDLVLNVREERTYQRGTFVYIGSRFVKPHKDANEIFMAQAEGNLISLVHFSTPDHLLIGADPSCDSQTIWYPNLYLLPPIGTEVRLILERVPAPEPAPGG